jgi:hypothetical protein
MVTLRQSARMRTPVLTDEKIRSGEIMTQGKLKRGQSTTGGLGLAEMEENSLRSNHTASNDGDQLSSRWVSAMKSLFDSRGDGIAS